MTYISSFHSLLKVLVDSSASVHYRIHGSFAITSCRLNNHGLHYPLEKSTLPTTVNVPNDKLSLAHGIGENACDRSHAEDYRCVTDSTTYKGCAGEAHNAGGYNETINTDTAKTTRKESGKLESSTIHAVDCKGYDTCHVTDLIKTYNESGRPLEIKPVDGTKKITKRHSDNKERREMTTLGEH